MWFQKAAEGGDIYAQWRLGKAYEFGDLGLLTDEEKALKWHRQAVDGGDGYAQDRLGDAYEKGELGLVTDKEEALKW